MGFTVSNYSFLGLQKQNWYVTIKGSYQVRKIQSLMPGSAQGGVGEAQSAAVSNSAGLNLPGLVTPYYTITFSVYYQSSQNAPVINDSYMSFNIQSLPSPAVLYLIIYDYIKGQLSEGLPKVDPYYCSLQQALVFQDD
jgi:Na+/H+ antiporter NhaB